MADREAILAELSRRGVDVSKLGAATPTGQNPAGPTPAPAKYPAGMLDALKAAGQRENTPMDVAQEVGSGWGRSVLNNSADTINMATTPARKVGGMMGLSIPEVPQLGDQLLPGGQMAPRESRDQVRAVSEKVPEALSMVGQLGGSGAALKTLARPLQAALGRGAARVAGTGGNAASGARVARSTPEQVATYIPQAQQARLAKAAKKSGGLRGFLKDQAAFAGVGAGAAEVTGQDPMKGAVLGMAFNNPMGRWAMSRVAGRMLGDKARAMTYVGSHPATKRSVGRLAKALKREER